jgi:tRNA nucleotidyltransferase (CCA-adding enzyme)
MDMPLTEELAARAGSLRAVDAAREAAERAGIAELYLIGGAVRDLARGAEPVDIDLAITGDPQALAAALSSNNGVSAGAGVTAGDGVAANSPVGGERNRPVGGETRFGTLTAHRDGVRYDIARTRTERYSHPGALPDVTPAPIEQDLLRRDFTVNAIALGLLGDRAGEVLAAPGAHDDLSAQRLAVLHDASFEDDPTRLLRVARYSARLGFEIAPHTRALAERAIASGALDTVSGTRVGNELRLLAAESDPAAAFVAVADLGLPWALDPDLTRSALDALPADGRPDLVVLAALVAHRQFGDGRTTSDQRPDLTTKLDRLGFTAADRDTIIEAATESSDLAERLSNANSRSEIASAVGTAELETVALASARGEPDRALLWLRELRHLRLEITGADLISSGVSEGPSVGKGLAAAQQALIDGHAPDRESQLAIALKAAQ